MHSVISPIRYIHVCTTTLITHRVTTSRVKRTVLFHSQRENHADLSDLKLARAKQKAAANGGEMIDPLNRSALFLREPPPPSSQNQYRIFGRNELTAYSTGFKGDVQKRGGVPSNAEGACGDGLF